MAFARGSVHLVSADRFSLAGHIGEYLREASVLILVFGFLDPLVTGSAQMELRERFSSVTGSWAIFVLIVSLMLFAIGAAIEWRRTS